MYNEVDSPDWNQLPLVRSPNRSSGAQNVFFSHNTRAGVNWNHYHAILGTGIPFRLQRAGTKVEVRLSPGSNVQHWQPGGIYNSMEPFRDQVHHIMPPFGSATCIKLSFELEEHGGHVALKADVERVMRNRAVAPWDWHDSVRLDIGQRNYPHMISLNMRFVETQNPDPSVVSTTEAEMFSIRDIVLKDEGPSTINGRSVYTYSFLIKLKHY